MVIDIIIIIATLMYDQRPNYHKNNVSTVFVYSIVCHYLENLKVKVKVIFFLMGKI